MKPAKFQWVAPHLGVGQLLKHNYLPLFLFSFYCVVTISRTQVALVVKNPPANAGDVREVGSIPGSGRSPGEGHGAPF